MTAATSCPVLIAEDDPSIRALLTTALRRRKLAVSAAADGRETLQHLHRQEWLVLVLDLMMPAVTGWDVIPWLAANRERKPQTVIVVSATDRALLRELDPSVVNGDLQAVRRDAALGVREGVVQSAARRPPPLAHRLRYDARAALKNRSTSSASCANGGNRSFASIKMD